MSYVPSTAGATAAIAAARRRRLQEQKEEEQTMNYDKRDLDGWEFKIVRSATGKFKHREAVQEVCNREQAAGWEMLEKFDNHRIRFKRRIEKRSMDPHIQGDPYNTTYGMAANRMGAIIVGVILIVSGLALAILLGFAR